MFPDRIKNPNKPKNIPKKRPHVTIIIPSRIIILKILFFVYPIALKIAKSPIRLSKLLARPEKMLKAEITIKIKESSGKTF